MKGKDAFQEVDYESFFGGMAKAVYEVNNVNSLNAIVIDAWNLSLTGRMGPVIITLPEDVLSETSSSEPTPSVPIQQKAASFSAVFNAIESAQQCTLIFGGYWLTSENSVQLQRIAKRLSLAVCCTFRRQNLFDNTHTNYIGELGLGTNSELITYIQQSDTVIVIDDRLSEVPGQSYTLFQKSIDNQLRIHIYPEANEFNRSFEAHLHIVANANDFVQTLPEAKFKRNQDIRTMRNSYLRWSSPIGDDILSRFMYALNQLAPQNCIFTNGAGNYAIWLQRFRRFKYWDSYIAPTSGSMGYGLPAAIAAQLCRPNHRVICFAGDGCFQMTMQELGVIQQCKLPIIIIVVDNGRYGTIRMHQERHYKGHTVGTNIINPDFAAIAQCYGINNYRIVSHSDCLSVLEECLSKPRPSLIHIKTDPDQLTPTLRIDNES